MGSDGEYQPKTKIVSNSADAANDKDQHQAAETVEHRSSSHSSSDVLQIPVHVAEEDVLGGVRQILTKLRPTWSSEDIQFKLFTDGITNKLVGCYHRPTTKSPADAAVTNSSRDAAAAAAKTVDADVVLIRIYGHKTDMLIDRHAETRNIKMLQRHGFAPSLYAVFQNGLAYEFVPGCTLTPQSVCDGRVWPLVARHMAKMHRLVVRSDGGGAPVPMLGTKTRSFLALVPERFADADRERRVRSLGLPERGALCTEFEALYARLRRLNSPVVFAHNDLLLGNVIYEESANRVAFIDYEYAAHNYQAFDIGNHFTEFTGIDEIDYARYPSEQFQCAWLRVYLAAYNEGDSSAAGGVDGVTEKEVRRLYGQVNAFALASHFFWAVWGLIQAEHSTIDFDFVLFAMTRYNEYLNRKDEFLALTE